MRGRVIVGRRDARNWRRWLRDRAFGRRVTESVPSQSRRNRSGGSSRQNPKSAAAARGQVDASWQQAAARRQLPASTRWRRCRTISQVFFLINKSDPASTRAGSAAQIFCTSRCAPSARPKTEGRRLKVGQTKRARGGACDAWYCSATPSRIAPSQPASSCDARLSTPRCLSFLFAPLLSAFKALFPRPSTFSLRPSAFPSRLLSISAGQNRQNSRHVFFCGMGK